MLVDLFWVTLLDNSYRDKGYQRSIEKKNIDLQCKNIIFHLSFDSIQVIKRKCFHIWICNMPFCFRLFKQSILIAQCVSHQCWNTKKVVGIWRCEIFRANARFELQHRSQVGGVNNVEKLVQTEILGSLLLTSIRSTSVIVINQSIEVN